MIKSFTILIFAIWIFSTGIAAQTSDDIKITYDKFKDETTVSGVRPFASFSSKLTITAIGITFQVSGNKVKEPNKFEVIFLFPLDFIKNSDAEWWAIADDERIKLGNISNWSKPVFSTNGITVVQYYGKVSISPAVLYKLAKANKVEMRIGNAEITEKTDKLWKDLQKSLSLYREILSLVKSDNK